MENILPVSDPPVIGYLHHAYMLSIVLNRNETLPLYFSNYIQLYCKKDILSNYQMDYFNFYNDKYIFDWDCIDKKVITKNEVTEPIVQFVIKCINNREYFYSYINKTAFPYRKSAFKEGRAHDFFIYGYNERREIFHALDFDSDNHFSKVTVSFEDFVRSYETAGNTYSWQSNIFLFRINNRQFGFDVSKTKEMIEDYCYSRNTPVRVGDGDPKYDHSIFGMDVYDGLETLIDIMGQDRYYCDVRPFQILWEHKKCMCSRIRYLMESGLLDPRSAIQDRYAEIEKKAQSLRMLVMKYRATNQKKLLDRMKNMLSDVRQEEYGLLCEMTRLL